MRKLHIEFERDGFAASAPIVFDRPLGKVSFFVENTTGDSHKTVLRLSLPAGERYEMSIAGRPVPLVPSGYFDYPWQAVLDIPVGASVELIRR